MTDALKATRDRDVWRDIITRAKEQGPCLSLIKVNPSHLIFNQNPSFLVMNMSVSSQYVRDEIL